MFIYFVLPKFHESWETQRYWKQGAGLNVLISKTPLTSCVYAYPCKWQRCKRRIFEAWKATYRLLETKTRNAVVSSSSRQSPLSLTKTHMKQHIAPNARAHECLLFGAPPAKIYIDNIASAAGASGENFEVLGANSPKNRCFCEEISKMKLPPKRDSPPIRV